jgi:hypothetical protein
MRGNGSRIWVFMASTHPNVRIGGYFTRKDWLASARSGQFQRQRAAPSCTPPTRLHGDESWKLDCITIKSGGRRATQSPVARADQTVSKLSGRVLPGKERLFN